MFTDCVCVSVILSDIDITMCDMTMQAGLDVEKFDAPPWGRIHFYVPTIRITYFYGNKNLIGQVWCTSVPSLLIF